MVGGEMARHDVHPVQRVLGRMPHGSLAMGSSGVEDQVGPDRPAHRALIVSSVLAAVFHDRLDIRVEEWPAPPEPPAGWVTVAVSCCGICGTDTDEYLRGPVVIPTQPHPLTGAHAPLVLGHEGAGVVTAAGPGAGIAVGARVGMENSVSCGQCPACLSGN